MITYLKYAFLALIMAGLVTIALANRVAVTVYLLPDALADFVGVNPSVTLPLFMLLGVGLGVGLFLGLIWEWLRERGYRSAAKRARQEAAALRADLERAEKGAPKQDRKDTVLSIVESR